MSTRTQRDYFLPGGGDLPADYGEFSCFYADIQCGMMIVLLHTMSMT